MRRRETGLVRAAWEAPASPREEVADGRRWRKIGGPY
jgi:hypothetical protein